MEEFDSGRPGDRIIIRPGEFHVLETPPDATVPTQDASSTPQASPLENLEVRRHAGAASYLRITNEAAHARRPHQMAAGSPSEIALGAAFIELSEQPRLSARSSHVPSHRGHDLHVRR